MIRIVHKKAGSAIVHDLSGLLATKLLFY